MSQSSQGSQEGAVSVVLLGMGAPVKTHAGVTKNSRKFACTNRVKASWLCVIKITAWVMSVVLYGSSTV
jgi:hypothetical protein